MGLPGRDAGVDGFFRAVVDASYGTSVPYSFHSVSYVVAPLLVGVLLLRGSPAARGAAIAPATTVLALAAVALLLRVPEQD
ncbi:hypothetical protein AB0H77_02750 [Streptomyces sp. NPDC050844]|uniref:hypothetical protein n=1 Tax=Streptomyces sp. NPDC050844 TaxID=3155790 RepID=UPI0033C5DC1D